MGKRILSLVITVVLAFMAVFAMTGCVVGNTAYTVWFEGNGGTLVSGKQTQRVYSASEISPPTYEREGYYFAGWDKDISKINKNTTVNALWDYYTVTFNKNGGVYVSGEVTQRYGKGSEIVAPVFEKEGYTLSWDVDISTLKSDCTVNAVWIENEYKIILGEEQGEVLVKYSKPIGELPIPEKEMYRFGSWLIDGKNIDQDTIYSWTEDKTAEALWLEQNQYLLYLDYDGGVVEHPNPNRYTAIDGNIFLNEPVKNGYDFIGWKDLKDQDSQPQQTVTIDCTEAKDRFFIAVWQAKTYTITLNTKGGQLENNTIEVTYGTSIGELPVPTLEDCAFLGWFNGQEKILDNDIWGYHDVTELVARYTREKFTIKFQLWSMVRGVKVEIGVSGGTPADREVDYNYVIGSYLPTGVYVKGDTNEYAFYGWTINDKKFDGSKYAYNNVKKDLTIYEFIEILKQGTETEVAIMEEIVETGVLTLIGRSRALWSGSH